MQQPPSFINQSKASYVYKLNKSLYGLEQAFITWYDKLDFAFSWFPQLSIRLFFLFVTFEPALVIVLEYVDDILVIGTNAQFAKLSFIG